MADHAKANNSSRLVHNLVMVIICLPLIYFLSVGPAVIIVVKVPSLRDPVRAFYAPMIWLHDRTFLKQYMDKYLGFWEQTARRF